MHCRCHVSFHYISFFFNFLPKTATGMAALSERVSDNARLIKQKGLTMWALKYSSGGKKSMPIPTLDKELRKSTRKIR